MWNEELRSNSMKGSGPEVSNYELPGDGKLNSLSKNTKNNGFLLNKIYHLVMISLGAASTLATPFSVSSNLFGLTGLCDQITSISSTDLSTSSKGLFFSFHRFRTSNHSNFFRPTSQISRILPQ